jgi:hypothetical protein
MCHILIHLLSRLFLVIMALKAIVFVDPLHVPCNMSDTDAGVPCLLHIRVI